MHYNLIDSININMSVSGSIEDKMFREITPVLESADRWRDVTINAGTSQSTLQDIKLPECADCYAYESTAEQCRNRFIYWRIHHDVIELVEVSLDTDLKRNHLRLRFQNTPILRGVSVSEHDDTVVLLVPIVSAIYKLVFPHPRTLDVSRLDHSSFSIFHDTVSTTIRDRTSYHVLNHIALGMPLPHTSCSWLNDNGEAHFVLANSSGSVLMVTMSNTKNVEIKTTELMKTGSLFRLLNGLVPTAIRGGKTEMAVGIAYLKDITDTYVFGLFSDLQIRVWSCNKQECILVDSVLNYDQGPNLPAGNFTVHQSSLRISSGEDKPVLGIYIPVPHKKLFYLFLTCVENGRLKLKLTSVLEQMEHDLVDFCIGCSHIWSLWLSNDNLPVVLKASLNSIGHSNYWISVQLESTLSGNVDYSDSTPQKAYLREIFKAGHFLPSSIIKAISIFNPLVNNTSTKKPEDLRGRVLEAVEGEILLHCSSIGDEGNVEVAAEAWDRFFSYCLQYQAVGTRPLGLSLLPALGLVALLKRSCSSVLCPCDPVPISLKSLGWIEMDEQGSLLQVLDSLSLVRQNLDASQFSRFEERLRVSLASPLPLVQELSHALEMKTTFLANLHARRPSSQHIVTSFETLIKKLDLGVFKNTKESMDDWGRVGGSVSGISALCSGLSHFARSRFSLCVDMLLLQLVLHESDCLESEHFDQIMRQAAIIPKTLSLMRCYYMLIWCTECECDSVSASIQESAFKQFCLLERPEFTSTNLNHMGPGQTITQAFFRGEGGDKIRLMLNSDTNSFDELFPQLVFNAASLLWPHGESVMFLEFLYAKCQHTPLKEYSQLLHGWCRWNQQLMQFIEASSCLLQGENEEALQLYLQVSRDLEPESLLCNRMLRGRHASLQHVYHMRVIELLELFNLSENIIRVATSAISCIKTSESATFHSVLFREQLSLGRWEEAASALMANPDSSRRKDCLRQLLLRLCQEKHLQNIVRLSDSPFEEEVVNILESRARCSDLRHNTSFYKVLFAIHVHQQKYRKAAAIMYELAMRFSREVVSSRGLKKQAECFLATINCLHLTEPEHAWIVNPLLQVPEGVDGDDAQKNTKRNSDGVKISHSNRLNKVEVLGLPEILREYSLVEARLLHSQMFTGDSKKSRVTTMPLTADETVALLLSAGLSDAAIKLSKAFDLSLVPVFEALTYKCLSSSYRVGIQDSDIDRPLYTKSTTDQSSRFRSWSHLEKSIFEHELPGKSDLHHCVTEKLLVHGATIPVWLESSYQKRNFTELLSLYILHGLLYEATVLMTKYIRAVMGICPEDFDLKITLNYSSPAVWLPYTYIDVLLCTGEESEGEFKEAYQEFQDSLHKYNEKLESVSDETLQRNSNIHCL